ncbi:hypothetical protein PM8797T_13368 [Gimesia maris DSM 8797]|nr:hypothetical protein PM8797T_13368 [Gimesia maris DSM 8797]
MESADVWSWNFNARKGLKGIARQTK